MDFAEFLHSSELSDITVVVDSKIYTLHKFPICIKSDFFRTLARSELADKDSVTLTDFPGGADTFQLAVNYCYNVRVDVSTANVCQLRCAAEFLQMISAGNLASVTDRFLQETLTNARVGRKLDVVLEMVQRCRSLGAIAEQADVIGKCISAIVDTWLITPIFIRQMSTSHLSVDTELLLKLCILPLNWFVELLRLAKERFVAATVRTALVQLYISKALDIGNDCDGKRKETEENRRTKYDQKPKQTLEIAEDKNENPENGHEAEDEEEKEEDEQEDGEGKKEEEENGDDEDAEKSDDTLENEDLDRENTISVEEDEDRLTARQLSLFPDDEDSAAAESDDYQDRVVNDEDMAAILDALLYECSDDTPSLRDQVSPKWIFVVLDKAVALGCKAQDRLIQMAARCLHRVSTEDLLQISPNTFVLILEEAGKESADRPVIPPGEVCRAVDSFLQCQSDRATLTPEIFRQILEALPEKYRTNEDSLFHVLESLLQSDETDLSDDERQSLLESIDYGRLSEVALNAAFNSKLVPVECITRAALLLSSRLRNDLDAANAVIQMQQDELNNLRDGSMKTYSSWTSESLGTSRFAADTPDTDYGRDSYLTRNRYRSTSRSKSYGTGTGSTGSGSSYNVDSGSYYRTVPSLASDLELQLALSSLGDVTRELHYGGRQSSLHSAYQDSRYPDPPAYDDTDYTRSYYRPLPSGQTYSAHKRYYAKLHR